MNRDIGLLESVILNKILSNGENIVEMYNLGSLNLHQLTHIASNNLT